MSVPAIGMTGMTGMSSMGGVDLTQLAAQYQNQILSGTGAVDGAGSAIGVGTTGAAAGARGAQFGDLVTNSLSQLEGLEKTASTKAIQAATGDLTDIQDYVIAATQAQTATELTTTVRNKALDSFNEIMRMQL